MSNSDRVILAAYNGEWPKMYKLEERRLAQALAADGVRSIEHVGSTAIPGMTAKPVIDIMAGMAGMTNVPCRDSELWSNLGYVWGHGSDDEKDWMFFIKRDNAGRRLIHLHIVQYEGDFWKRMVLFRDALRDDHAKAEEYRRLKVVLADTVGRNRLQYLDGKAAFVAGVVAEAEGRYTRKRYR